MTWPISYLVLVRKQRMTVVGWDLFDLLLHVSQVQDPFLNSHFPQAICLALSESSVRCRVVE